MAHLTLVNSAAVFPAGPLISVGSVSSVTLRTSLSSGPTPVSSVLRGIVTTEPTVSNSGLGDYVITLRIGDVGGVSSTTSAETTGHMIV